MYFNVGQLAVLFAICWVPSIAEEGRSEKVRRGNLGSKQRPNILHVTMDDVGIDQLKLFGYGGLAPINTPVMDALAAGGIKFHNTWASPDCSPSRTSTLTGRHSIRTNVTTAIIAPDLAQNQINPYEVRRDEILELLASLAFLLVLTAYLILYLYGVVKISIAR